MNKEAESRLFEQLDKIDDRTDKMSVSLAALTVQVTDMREICPRHSEKIGALETFKDKTSGIIMVVGAIIGMIAAAVTSIVVNIIGGHKQ